MAPCAHTEPPTLLGRTRLQLGGGKGWCGVNGGDSAKRVQNTVIRSWNFPRQQSRGEHQAKCRQERP